MLKANQFLKENSCQPKPAVTPLTYKATMSSVPKTALKSGSACVCRLRVPCVPRGPQMYAGATVVAGAFDPVGWTQAVLWHQAHSLKMVIFTHFGSGFLSHAAPPNVGLAPDFIRRRTCEPLSRLLWY